MFSSKLRRHNCLNLNRKTFTFSPNAKVFFAFRHNRMNLEAVNNQLAALQYSGLTQQDLTHLDTATDGKWESWLIDVSNNGKEAQGYEDFRSTLMALSSPVSEILNELHLHPSPMLRIRTFLREGRKIRGAVSAYVKEGRAMPRREIREAFLNAFNHGKSAMSNSIARKVHHVFATKSAVTFECAMARDTTACLQIEAAERSDRNQGFNWQDKIIVQLKDVEAMELLAVLNGDLNFAEFAHHGSANDKRVSISKTEQGGYLLSVRKASTARVVPIPAFDVFKITSLVLQVLMKNSPHLSVDHIMGMCKVAASPAST